MNNRYLDGLLPDQHFKAPEIPLTESEVQEVRPTCAKPDHRIARLRYHAVNPRSEVLLTLIINHRLRCRQT